MNKNILVVYVLYARGLRTNAKMFIVPDQGMIYGPIAAQDVEFFYFWGKLKNGSWLSLIKQCLVFVVLMHISLALYGWWLDVLGAV